ncbi:MAG TPA: hypothetical protein VNY51_12330 [Candidatus Dormibacteraeota bacterium]|jgi:hypothetical protein|nr:hypothetical protein [Candidatus Dormibacteraeota bacterium]
MQLLPFQDSFGGHSVEAVSAGAAVATQVPLLPFEPPGGHSAQWPSLQILRRKSASAGFGSGSLQSPLGQILRRRSDSGVLLSFSFSFTSGASPMRGEETILPSLPDSLSPEITRPPFGSDERIGDAALDALQSEDDGPEAWLPDELGMGAAGLSGILAGLGLLGALVCDTLEAVLDEALGDGLGAGAGGGLLGALLVEECCAKTAEEKSSTTATTRLESRIKHLLSTAGDFSVLHPLRLSCPISRVARNRVKERNDSVKNRYVRFSKMPAAPMPPPTHMVTMP